MRELIIKKYKQLLEKQFKAIPDFEKMSDEELFKRFLEVYGQACQTII
jgi:hypothetical protein